LNNQKVNLYGRVSGGYLASRLDAATRARLRALHLEGLEEVDHVFLAPGDLSYDWNCFGGGVNELRNPNAKAYVREIGSAVGNVVWMNEVYRGLGRGDSAGVNNCFNGVCQSVGNRLMAMAEGDCDASKAKGNELVVLVYGKYGFGVDEFIALVRERAAALNERMPGCVAAEDVERVVAKLNEGLKPKSEIDALIDDLPLGFRDRLVSELGANVETFVRGYAGFQERREEKYHELERRHRNKGNIQGEMMSFIVSELKAQEETLLGLLKSEDRVRTILPLPPETIMTILGSIM